MKDEKFHTCLSNLDIAWRFNLSRAPWWGGQFERLIGMFKSSGKQWGTEPYPGANYRTLCLTLKLP